MGDVWGPFSLSNAMKRSSLAFSKKIYLFLFMKYNLHVIVSCSPKKKSLHSKCYFRGSSLFLLSSKNVFLSGFGCNHVGPLLGGNQAWPFPHWVCQRRRRPPAPHSTRHRAFFLLWVSRRRRPPAARPLCRQRIRAEWMSIRARIVFSCW